MLSSIEILVNFDKESEWISRIVSESRVLVHIGIEIGIVKKFWYRFISSARI